MIASKQDAHGTTVFDTIHTNLMVQQLAVGYLAPNLNITHHLTFT